MAKRQKTEPEYELKHRLTGAVILIISAVLIIPLLLKEPGTRANVDVGAAFQHGNETFTSTIEPLVSEEQPNAPIILQGDDVAGGEQEKPALLSEDENNLQHGSDSAEDGAESQEKQVVMTADGDEQSESAPETQAPEETAVEDGWTVRVGTFSNKANVESVSKLLNDNGFDAHQTKVQTTLGEAIRVWLGPYQKKETAEKVSARLKALTGEKGYITRQAS